MSKRKSNAKKSAAKPSRKRRRVPVDAYGNQWLFDPRTGKPTSPAVSLSAAKQRHVEQRRYREAGAAMERMQKRLAEADARRAAFRARLSRRPVEMRRDGYRLPADVAAFLMRFHQQPAFCGDEKHVSVEKAVELIEAAFMEGCRQGFIEGFVTRRQPDVAKTKIANDAKRKTSVVLPDGTKLTRDERDAAIVAQYADLRPRIGAGEAQHALATHYGLTDKMIRNILTKAKRAAR